MRSWRANNRRWILTPFAKKTPQRTAGHTVKQKIEISKGKTMKFSCSPTGEKKDNAVYTAQVCMQDDELVVISRAFDYPVKRTHWNLRYGKQSVILEITDKEKKLLLEADFWL